MGRLSDQLFVGIGCHVVAVDPSGGGGRRLSVARVTDGADSHRTGRVQITARAALALVLTLSTAAPLRLGAQQYRGFGRLEAGRAEIHRPSGTAAVAALRIGRRLGAGDVARFELGATTSRADEGFLTLELGLELRLPLGPAALFVGPGAGLLLEPEFGGPVVRVAAGVELRVTDRTALRAGAQSGRHGGTPGPNLVFVGIELRGAP